MFSWVGVLGGRKGGWGEGLVGGREEQEGVRMGTSPYF